MVKKIAEIKISIRETMVKGKCHYKFELSDDMTSCNLSSTLENYGKGSVLMMLREFLIMHDSWKLEK